MLFQSSNLEGLFCHVSENIDVRTLRIERAFRKCHPIWDWLYQELYNTCFASIPFPSSQLNRASRAPEVVTQVKRDSDIAMDRFFRIREFDETPFACASQYCACE